MRYCLGLDLVNDPEAMAAYEAHHRAVWPEIKSSIVDGGITAMEIYRVGNRLFMIMAVATVEEDREPKTIQRMLDSFKISQK